MFKFRYQHTLNDALKLLMYGLLFRDKANLSILVPWVCKKFAISPGFLVKNRII